MKKITAIYPGTFDPVTNGHLDIIERSSGLFEKVIVAIAVNPNKNPLFSEEERIDMLKRTTAKFRNVEIDSFSGLLMKYAQKKKAQVIVRGLRAISDFEYEFQMSLTNRKLNPGVTTIFLMPNEKFSYLNSSLVRELASYNTGVREFVPAYVYGKLRKRFSVRRK